MPGTKKTVPIVVDTPIKKPGYKSTEFYMSMAAVVVGAVASSGMLEDGSVLTKVVGLVMAALVALGYTGSRLTLKKLDAEHKNGNGNPSDS